MLAIVFILGGCANAPLTQSQIDSVNNIAVVSLLGDEMSMTLLGSTIFQNDKTDINVTKWNLRQSFKEAMIKETKKNGKTFLDIKFDREKVTKAMKKKKDTQNRLMNQDENQINEYLLKTAAAGGAKFLWIISPSAHPYYPEQTGYGIFCRAPAGSTGEWHSYLSFHAALWDTTKEVKVYQGAVNPEMMKVPVVKSAARVRNSVRQLSLSSSGLRWLKCCRIRRLCLTNGRALPQKLRSKNTTRNRDRTSPESRTACHRPDKWRSPDWDRRLPELYPSAHRCLGKDSQTVPSSLAAP